MRITEISSLKKQKNLHESIAADSKPLEPTGTEVQKIIPFVWSGGKK